MEALVLIDLKSQGKPLQFTEASIILKDGGIATIHHNGNSLVTTYYQDRLKSRTVEIWDKLGEGKAYVKEWLEEDIHYITNKVIDNALLWLELSPDKFDLKCEFFNSDKEDEQTLIQNFIFSTLQINVWLDDSAEGGTILYLKKEHVLSTIKKLLIKDEALREVPAYKNIGVISDDDLLDIGYNHYGIHSDTITKSELDTYKLYVEYPFKEGDDYYTIEDGDVIWSCWDDVSEDLHDEDPTKVYFKCKEDAFKELIKQNVKETTLYDSNLQFPMVIKLKEWENFEKFRKNLEKHQKN